MLIWYINFRNINTVKHSAKNEMFTFLSLSPSPLHFQLFSLSSCFEKEIQLGGTLDPGRFTSYFCRLLFQFCSLWLDSIRGYLDSKKGYLDSKKGWEILYLRDKDFSFLRGFT